MHESTVAQILGCKANFSALQIKTERSTYFEMHTIFPERNNNASCVSFWLQFGFGISIIFTFSVKLRLIRD